MCQKKSDKNGRSRARDREMNTNAMTEGNENQVASAKFSHEGGTLL